MDDQNTGSGARRLASKVINALGLRRWVFRWREWRTSRSDPRIRLDPESSPAPSAYLRTLVIGKPDLEWFLDSGRRDADAFDDLLSAHGGGLYGEARVLEWGCGCGRLSRWTAPRVGAFTGVDINRRLVGWCADNLPGRYLPIRFKPPMPLADGAFDLVYACSVLTHMREESARSWLAELARVLRPGGRALLTFHDAEHPGAAPVRDQLIRTGYAVRFDRLEGSNHLAAYATPERLAALAAPHFQTLSYTPSSRSVCFQGIVILEKRGERPIA